MSAHFKAPAGRKDLETLASLAWFDLTADLEAIL